MESKSTDNMETLGQLGVGLVRRRLELNLTQVDLAREAGVSLRTLGRLEGGESIQLTNLIRILRALGLLEKFEDLVPPRAASPLEQLRTKDKQPKRASRAQRPRGAAKNWTWDDPDQEPEADA